MAERPEDLNLPNAVITRIIKEALPEGVNVSKDARVAMSKAASIFVLYATSCANNFAMKNKRKTIGAMDVLSAMEDMEFERFIEPLKSSLNAYKKEQQGKKEATEKRKKDREQGNNDEDDKEAGEDEEEDIEDASEEEQKDVEEVVIEDEEEET